MDFLSEIVARKKREVARRKPRLLRWRVALGTATASDPAAVTRALRRAEGEPPRVIAEIKHASPTAGAIRAREPGGVARIARAYVEGGAAAVSVLADAPSFGGTPLDVRRVARAVEVPVLFKEFVLDESQLRLAAALGASMVLLLVRCLDDATLGSLIAVARGLGLEPVVEAADARELDRALATGATIVGVNARDLRTFRVDRTAAAQALSVIPADRIAVLMSGILTHQDFAEAAATRADAVLVGEALMRAHDPAAVLRSWTTS